MRILLIVKKSYLGPGNIRSLTSYLNAMNRFHQVNVHSTDNGPLSDNPLNYDCIISWNNSLIDLIDNKIAITHPTIHFIIQDCPLTSYHTHILNKPTGHAIWERSNIWIYDEFYVAILKKLGFPNAQHLPHGVYDDSPAKAVPLETQNRPIDISFVGSLNDPLEHKLGKPISNEAKKQILKLNDACLEEMKRNVSQPFYKAFFKVVDEPEDFAMLIQDVQNYYFYFTSLIHSTYALRREYVFEVAKHHPVTLYTKTKPKIPKACNINIKECNSITELFEVYNNSKIVLNGPHLQQIDGINQRYYNVSAMNGFLLTTTPNPQFSLWKNISNPEHHFSSIPQLIEQVGRHLQNPRLNETIQPIRDVLLAQHGIENRIHTLLGINP
jgi:hypothetical protein